MLGRNALKGGLLALLSLTLVLAGFSTVREGLAQAGPTITLAPATATNAVGSDHTVTATVGNSLAGTPVTFTITAGPNMGATGVCNPINCSITASSNDVTFTYTGSGGTGDDTIQACIFENPCTTATKTWAAATESPSPSPSSAATASPTTTAAAGSVTPSPTASAAAATGSPTRTAVGLPITGGRADDAGAPWVPLLAFVAGAGLIGAGTFALARRRS